MRLLGKAMLKDKTIVLGVSGSIAAYKSLFLTRLLRERRARVLPVLTKSASRFVGALSFSALAQTRAVTDLWAPAQAGEIGHVEWAHEADLMVIAPATANTLARLSLGLADDPLTAIALATKAPLLVAPAMEDGMWNHPATVQHINALQARGGLLAEPQAGHLASGRTGQGRMMEPESLLELIEAALSPADLSGLSFVVTAGPTQEPLDPVRFLSNYSSGKMGYAIARRAHQRGATVHLISGPSSLSPPTGVHTTHIQTTREMLEAVKSALPQSTTLVMAAAPADYRPESVSPQKLKKTGAPGSINLQPNPDILTTLLQERAHCFTVGFAAESCDLLQNAQNKLLSKNLDLIVANDITAPNAGFGGDTNTVTLLSPQRSSIQLPTLSKDEVADKILDEILQQQEKSSKGHV